MRTEDKALNQAETKRRDSAKLVWPVSEAFVQLRAVVNDDIDAFGHVNNVRYIDWANEIAWAHSHALGLTFEDYKRLGTGVVVWHHEFDYLAAAKQNDEIAIATWIVDNDNRIRLTRNYEMRRTADGVVVFRGSTLFVTIDMTTGKPARMPPEFIAAYKVTADMVAKEENA